MTVTVRWQSLPHEIGSEAIDEMAIGSGLTPGDGPGTDLTVSVRWSGDPDLSYDPVHRRRTDEAYLVELGQSAGDEIELTVTGTRSLRWALVDLNRRAQGKWQPGRYRSSPGFAVRGIIEGFYGRPWSDEARLDMIDFAARNRFNTFLYAPKDDRFLRREWRSPFDEPSRIRLEEVVTRCISRDIDAMVGISPGLSMRYSSRDDSGLLAEKIVSIIETGATRIALLFDDIPPTLQHPEDVDTFPDLAAAHAQTANRVFDVVGPDLPMVVCPTIYWGAGDEDYISRLGAELDPRVDLFWTGRAVCSPAITADEAAHFSRVNRRPPLYWDNYPVNDVAMINEMHIGPYQNRDSALDRFSQGVMANAMEYPEASKIALATIADYLWDPSGYEPDRAWEAAITQVAGEADARAMMTFADTVRASCLSDPEPHGLTSALQRLAFQIEVDDKAVGADLAAFAGELTAAAEHLLGDGVENQSLQAELMPWLLKFRRGAEAVDALAVHTADGKVSDDGRTTVAEFRSLLRSDPHRVFGDVLDMALTDAIT